MRIGDWSSDVCSSDRADGPVGLVLGPDIDLRVFFSGWDTAWAVEQEGRHSLQFFDRAGDAVHKVYRTDATDIDAYDALVVRFAGEPAWPQTRPYPPGRSEERRVGKEGVRTCKS